MTETYERGWLLLIHQIPPKPDYFRVKIWRRLQKIGAVAIKNSVYVLPRKDQALEDFQWTLREITEGGGEGSICEADFIDGLSGDQVEALFRAVRDADYAAITEEARELARKAPSRAKRSADDVPGLETAVERLRRRLAEVAAIDFFDALGHQTAEGLVSDLEARFGTALVHPAHGTPTVVEEFQGRVWVTRRESMWTVWRAHG